METRRAFLAWFQKVAIIELIVQFFFPLYRKIRRRPANFYLAAFMRNVRYSDAPPEWPNVESHDTIHVRNVLFDDLGFIVYDSNDDDYRTSATYDLSKFVGLAAVKHFAVDVLPIVVTTRAEWSKLYDAKRTFDNSHPAWFDGPIGRLDVNRVPDRVGRLTYSDGHLYDAVERVV